MVCYVADESRVSTPAQPHVRHPWKRNGQAQDAGAASVQLGTGSSVATIRRAALLQSAPLAQQADARWTPWKGH